MSTARAPLTMVATHLKEPAMPAVTTAASSRPADRLAAERVVR
ncbi:hypothetical protein [Streptomyces avermitilis]